MGHPRVGRSSGRIAPARCVVGAAWLVVAMACAAGQAQGQGTGGTEERAGDRKPTRAESRRDQTRAESTRREAESFREGRGPSSIRWFPPRQWLRLTGAGFSRRLSVFG